MNITFSTKAIGNGKSANFGASGGTPPYRFSIVPNGVNGFINPITGQYIAPFNTGSDVIRAIDSDGNEAQLTIMVGNTLELVCDILRQELGLSDDQVYLWDQKVDIPPDERLYVAVGIVTCRPFGNTNEFVDGNSIQSTNFQANLSIDIFSRNLDAVNRKEEVVMALMGQYSQRQQTLNSFRIFSLPNNFVNLSNLEGAAIPYRFHIEVNIQYQVTKVTPVDYFDDFSTVKVTTDS